MTSKPTATRCHECSAHESVLSQLVGYGLTCPMHIWIGDNLWYFTGERMWKPENDSTLFKAEHELYYDEDGVFVG